MSVKIRVMPTLLYKDLGLVKGKGFDSWRRVGSVMQSVKVYNMREVDELVFPKLDSLKIARADLCSDAVFVRRAYLDIIGTLPTPDEARKFLADKAPDKRAATTLTFPSASVDVRVERSSEFVRDAEIAKSKLSVGASSSSASTPSLSAFGTLNTSSG